MPSVEFTWKVPSISYEHRSLICEGWVHQNCEQYIIPPLMRLFTQFYTNDKYCIEQVINTQIGTRLHGPTFCINSCHFYLELYPNGTTADHAGQLAVFCCLAPIQATIQCIRLDFTFKLLEIDATLPYAQHSYDLLSFWKGLYTQTPKIKALQSMTFQLNVYKMLVQHKDGTVDCYVAYKEPDQQLLLSSPITITERKPELYLWEVTDTECVANIHHAPNVWGYASPIFIIGNIKWYLTFYPNGSKIDRVKFPNVFLHLAALPLTDIQVNVRHSQALNGDEYMKDARFDTIFEFDKSSWGLVERSAYSMVQLTELQRFLCVAEIILLELYQNDQVIELKEDAKQYDYVTMGLEPFEFEWRLEDATMKRIKQATTKIECESTVFDAFGLRWQVFLYPFGENNFEEQNVVIGVRLVDDAVAGYTVNVRLFFQVCDVNKRYIGSGMFDARHKDTKWGNGRVKTEEITALNECTIKICVELIDVYKDGLSVLDSFL